MPADPSAQIGATVLFIPAATRDGGLTRHTIHRERPAKVHGGIAKAAGQSLRLSFWRALRGGVEFNARLAIRVASEQFQEKRIPVFRPELRQTDEPEDIIDAIK